MTRCHRRFLFHFLLPACWLALNNFASPFLFSSIQSLLRFLDTQQNLRSFLSAERHVDAEN
ncbi:hypothetical protein PISMIDRAFT_678398, partial [Pisolithus microcarpus 441]